ncbi:MAG TPA: hypothetical protein VGU21_06205 [Streptosporangiaceae bacterium]|nr:hypothetical protein [Streptosporangiaceae bacterium]
MISRELRWSRVSILGYFFILGVAFAVSGLAGIFPRNQNRVFSGITPRIVS